MRNVLTEFIPNPTFEVVARPGAHMAFYAGEEPRGEDAARADRRADAARARVPRPGRPRCEVLDEQGVHACLMFPTLASLIEERLRDDPT